MSTLDLHALLGDTYDDTTPEQRDAVIRAADAVAARWPRGEDGDDYADERTAALGAALEVILGDSTDEQIAADARAARLAWLEAQARLTGAIIAGSILHPGEREQPRAVRLGTTRDTVRKALGR